MISKAVELLQSAKRKGINISLDKGELQLKFSKGTKIDAVLLQQIKDNKIIITDFLSNNNWKSRKVQAFENDLRPFDRKEITDIPLSFGQERLWFIHQLEGSVKYHLPSVLRLKGGLDISALRFAFQTIVNRHEVLRTVFYEKEGHGYQRVLEQNEWTLKVVNGSASAHDNRALFNRSKELIDHPFDLSKDYMLRAHLIELGLDDYLLVATMHHIASDGWSMSILVNELVELYESFVKKIDSKLLPLELQYADYAVWQRRYLSGENLQRKLAYWQRKLQSVKPLELNTDYARPAVMSSEGAVETFSLDKSVTHSLNELSQKQGATLFMTLLAAFKILLYKYSGQQDVSVGTPIANRTQQELEGLIGFFVNTLALRSEVNATQSFTDFLQEVKATVLGAYEHQEVPFEKVVDAVVKERNISRNPVFQVMFVLKNTPDIPQLRLGDIALSGSGNEHTTALFDITLSVTETSRGLQCAFEYSTELYQSATIKSLIAHFQQLVVSIIQTPNQKIGDLNMLTQQEEHSLLFGFNQTEVDYPKDKTLVDLFEEQVAKTPEAIAVTFNGEELTYQQLNAKANQLAHCLQTKGVKPEAPIPICIERGPDMIVGLLGILKAGAAYVPIDPEYPADRIVFMLEDTAATIVLTSKESRQKLREAAEVDFIEMDGPELAEYPSKNPAGLATPHSVAYIIYTSGSTGKPKGVMVEHINVVRLFKTERPLFDFNQQDVWTMFHSFCFDFSVWEMYGALLFGGKLVIVPAEAARDISLFADLLVKEKVTVLNQTPTAFYNLQDYVIDRTMPLSVRYVIFGGEALNVSKLQPWNQYYKNCRLINMYGITETTVHVTYIEILAEQIQAGKSVIGKPIPTLTAYILDAEKNLVPLGVSGEIYIGGAGLSRGYLNLPDLTAERFIQNPFSKEAGERLYRTGDLGRWLPDGNLEYLGRIDDQVKIRGYRIELGEIEGVLLQSGLVKQAVVIARQEANGNRQLVGYVVAEGAFDRQALIAHLGTKLPGYMIPALWVQLERIPLTSNGKIDRKALPDVDASETLTNQFVAPRTQTEKDLCAVWQQLLGVEAVGIYDNFFELGGDSILTIQVVSRAGRLGYELRPKDIFIHQTVAKLAAVIAERTGSEATGEQGILTGTSGLLPIQQWYLQQQQPNPSHYNQSVLLGIDKTVTAEALRTVVEKIAAQHDALRFKYNLSEGKWQQAYQAALPALITEDLPSADNVSAAITQLAEQYQRSLNLEKGEIAKFVLLQTPQTEESNRLLIVIHHLAVDGVSWRILLEDIELLLTAITNGEKATLGNKSSSYRQWYKALKQYGQSDRSQNQLDYWSEAARNYQPLPVDTTCNEKVTVNEAVNYSHRLAAEATRNLVQEVPRVYHTEINDILLSSLAKTISNWSKEEKVTIGLEGHGREDIAEGIDTSRTVGWFTNLYPVLLSIKPGSREDDLIKTVKEQLRQVPDRGIGYGVLKYISKEETLQGKEPWDIVFNYLGQTDNIVSEGKWFTGTREASGAARSEEQVMSEKIAVNCIIRGGQLSINWTYSSKHYNESTIQKLAENFTTNLETLIAHCIEQQRAGQSIYTPSDYGLGKEISYQQLDTFLNEPFKGKPRREQLESLYRLSGLQQGMLFHNLYDGGSAAYTEQFVCDLIGADITALKESWNKVIAHHSVLRSAFYYDRFSVPVQCVYKEVALPVEVLDLHNTSEENQKNAIDQYQEEDKAKGFDLQEAPLMRLGLLKLSEDRYRMIWTSHHILFDGWSLPVLIEELLSNYEHIVSGKGVSTQNEDRYEDYIRYIERTDKGSEEAYWRSYMQGVQESTLLPFIPAIAERTKGAGKYKSIAIQIEAGKTAEIQGYAQKHRITINTLMQGVWACLLHHYTNTDHIVYGAVVSGRPDDLPNIEQRVGLYINTLPLHSTISKDQDITEWLQQLQQAQVASRQYQHTPLSQVQSWTGVQGDLFDSLLIFENYPVSKVVSSKQWGLQVENVQMHEQTNYPLTITIGSAEKISIGFEYNATLIEAQYVQNIKEHFWHVLQQITENTANRFNDIKLLTNKQEQQLLHAFNDTKADYPKDKTLVDVFAEQAIKTPDATAIEFGEEQVSYKELDERSGQLAHYLQEKGVTKETLVAVCIERSVDMIVSILAILKSGAAYIPIDPEYPEERISYMLEDSKASICITSTNSRTKLTAAETVEVIEVDLERTIIEHFPSNELKVAVTPNNLAYVIYTSGSTGKPKGVMIEHGSLLNLLYSITEQVNFQSDCSLLSVTTYSFDICYLEFFTPLINGGKLIVASRQVATDGYSLAEALARYRPTHMQGTPSTWQLLLDAGWENQEQIQILAGGEALKESLKNELTQLGEVYNLYGPTETTIWSAIKKLERNEKVLIGKPLANTSIYLLNSALQLTAVGCIGEVYIGGAGLARGYLNRTELTAEKFIKDPFSKVEGARLYKTGDLGKWLPDGNIEYISRIDDQVKIRGYRIELGEIESAIIESGLVKEAVVVAKEDSAGNKRLVGYVVTEGTFNREELQLYLKTKLPDYMVPGIFVELESLPLTPNGKTDRKALPHPDLNELASQQYEAPRNETEQKIAEIWQHFLKVERVGIYHNFFALGGHSLLAMQIISAIRQQLKVEVSIRNLFIHPSIAELSAHLHQQGQGELLPFIEKQSRPQNIPLSFSQERLWFIDQLEGSLQYNLPTVLRLKGALNKEAFEHALKTIIDRHEVLRTVFLEQNGHPYQYVKNGEDWHLNFVNGSIYKEDFLLLQDQVKQFIRHPFDLSKDYMLRAELIELNDQDYVLVVVMHHIASDAWSLPIIIHEVSELYSSYVHKKPASLLPLQLQYADYALWQRNYLTPQVLDDKINYWKEKLDGVETLQLPTDFTRPSVTDNEGASFSFRIDKTLSEDLYEVSHKQGTTIFMTLLAAFKVLLHRYSGQTDISVGTSIANRSQQEVEGLIGFFVNTIAFRDRIESDTLFAGLLEQVKATTIGAYENQDVPFEKVVEAVVKDRDAGTSPLFQVMLVLGNTPQAPQLNLSELVLSGENYDHGISKFDLTFFVTETPNGIQGMVQYRTDLFAASTIARMTAHFTNLLQSVVKNPLQKVGLLPMLSAAEEQQLVGLNKVEVAYPKDATIVSLFEEQVLKTPQATAVVYDGEELTYEALNAKANQLAHYLRQRGVKEDTLVPVYIERSQYLIVGIIGVMKAGAAYVPIDTDFPADRISYMIKDSRSLIVISSKESRSKLETAEPDTEIIEIDGTAFSQQPENNPKTLLQPYHLAYVIYTSGSTGMPKGVMIEHRNLVDYVFGLNYKIQVEQAKSYALVSSIATDLGNTVIYSSLVFGGALHLFSKEQVSNIEYLHDYFQTQEIDCLKIVPSHWKALSLDEELLLPKKLLIFGGEALQSALVADIRQTGSNCKVVNHYGPTETTIGKLLHQTEANKTYNHTIPIGKPFSNTKVYVLSKELQLTPQGVPGQLYIAGDGVARGYLNNEELTQIKFIQNPFEAGRMYATGDLVKYLPDGNIEFIGRVDDQVKIRGYRVELGEIESILQQSELVSQAVVLAKDDKQGNKRLIGYIVPEDGWFDREAIQSYLKEKLPEYMIPAQLVELESLPLTANGKVNRKALPDPEATEQSADKYAAPTNEAEARLTEIWQDVLEEEKIGIHDNFFELGGHSLLAVRLISAIRKEFAVEIPISHVFDYPTIALLAAELDVQSDATVLPPIVAIHPRPEKIPLSFSQERLWFIDRLEGSVQYHVPAVLRLKGHLNKEALAQALQTIVNRHEVLRTVILEIDGQPYQHIKEKDQWQLTLVDGNSYTEIDLAQHINEAIKRPFKLDEDDMLRAELVYLNASDNILILTLHHIASDGWSKSILVEELAELYTAFDEKRTSNLIPLSIQYADFSIWQRDYLKEEILEKKLNYWKNKLENVTPLQLSTDYARPAVQTTRGGGITYKINKQLANQLQQLSQQRGTTMFMTMLAAFNALLHRYTGQQDIAVGTGIAGRQQKELERLLGFFINTLVLRSEVKGNETFTNLLNQVKATTMEAYENQEVPFEKVVEAVVKERDNSRTPLFQVMFVFRNTPEVPELNLGNTQLENWGQQHNTSLFDLTFYVTETPKGLNLGIEYNSDLFAAATIKRMAAHFEQLLQSVVETPDKEIGKLAMLSLSEKEQLLAEFNHSEENFGEVKSLVTLFEEQVEKMPNNIALAFGERRVTYLELNQLANQLANLLRSKGILQESLVPVCMERSVEMIVGLLGILKAGGAYVPIDPAYPAERINFMIRDTGAKLIITSKELDLKFENDLDLIILDCEFSALNGLSGQNTAIEVKPTHLAYVIYTSGSTGTPKGVMVPHGSVFNLVKWHTKDYEVTSESKATAMAGVGFDAFGWEIWPYLSNGASVNIIDNTQRLSVKELIKIFNSEKITHSFISTALAGEFVSASAAEVPSLKYLLTGGDKLPAIDVSNITYQLVNNYGPTENTVVATSYKIPVESVATIPPIGAPVSNTKIYIVSTETELVPVGVIGEICIAGRSLAKGYLNMPELTKEKFVQNPFDNAQNLKMYKTGDLGRWLPNGTVEYAGRKDDQIKIRGHRVEIGEIENVVLQSNLVKQIVVVVKQDEGFNNNLVGYVVIDEEFDKEALINYLQSRLPHYMMPVAWVSIDKFPLTANGKIDKKALPEPEIGGQLKQYVSPANNIEESLVLIWQNLLKLDRIGVEENFFELGGHSLLAMRLAALIEAKWSISIPVSVLFQFTTIREFSKYLELQLTSLSTEKNTTTFELLDV